MQPIPPERGLRPAPREQLLFGGPGVVFALLATYLLAASLLPGGSRPMDLGSTPERAVGWFFLVLLGFVGVGGLLALLTAGGKLPRWEVDAEGIALRSPLGSAEVPWGDVQAVGVGWKRPPRNPTVMTRFEQGHALELFLRCEDPAAAYPRLGRLLVEEEPPLPELPGRRVRLVLSTDDAEERVEQRLGSYAGERWLGSYERQWRRVPGT